MLISVGIIALNEAKVLESLFLDIKNQDYPHQDMEIILVDSGSTDNTIDIMNNFKQQNPDFANIQICNNPKRIQSCGWNVALQNYTGDIFIKIDAHANVPSDFVSKSVACIMSGEDVCGGKRPNIITDPTPFKNMLLIAESSMFGSSIASYRRQNEKSYVRSIFHGTYKRQVLQDVGPFNERLGRTEDNEFHYRITKAGYKICLDPSIISYQHTRSSLSKMLKQKYANGYWIGLTLGVCPGCLSLFHFVPFAFVCSIIITLNLLILEMPIFAIVLWSAYWLCAFSMGFVSIISNKFQLVNLLLPFLFFALHISYGVGTIVGVIKMPFVRKSLLGAK